MDVGDWVVIDYWKVISTDLTKGNLMIITDWLIIGSWVGIGHWVKVEWGLIIK